MRRKLEEEKQALISFVTKFDALGLSSSNMIPTRLRQPFSIASAHQPRKRSYSLGLAAVPEQNSPSPIKMQLRTKDQTNLLKVMPDESMCLDSDAAEVSFELVLEEDEEDILGKMEKVDAVVRNVFSDKENIPV